VNVLRHTILGLFFFVTLAVLAFVTIYLGGFHLFDHPVVYVCYTADAGNLGSGDPVLVFGKAAGRVDEVVFTEGAPPPEKRLRVTFTLDRPIQLREDYAMLIGSQSLLGGRELDIDTGSGKPLAADRYSDLRANSEGNVIRQLGRVLNENQGDLRRIVGGLADIVDGMKTGERNLLGLLLSREAYENVNAGLAAARSALDKVDHGEGSVAKAINSPALHDSILRFTDEGGTLLKDAREKNGIIHTLVYDEESGAKFKSGVDGLAVAAGRIGKGEGLLGKLTTAESEATWNDVKSLAADASALAADLRAGKGAIGKLMSDPEVEAALVTIATRFASVATDASKLTDDARRGRGVIGWLFSDDEARRTVERLAKQLERAVEDAREAAPVTSVASFLFGQL
jgi:hypothetical protein